MERSGRQHQNGLGQRDSKAHAVFRKLGGAPCVAGVGGDKAE